MAEKSKFTPIAVIDKKYPNLWEARNIAMEQGQTYGPDEEHNARGDALRHIVWQALMAKGYTPQLAKAIGEWHELPLPRWLGAAGVPIPQALGGEGLAGKKKEATMDLYNNALGREIASKANNMQEILQMAKEYVDSGKAKYTPVDQLGEDAAY